MFETQLIRIPDRLGAGVTVLDCICKLFPISHGCMPQADDSEKAELYAAYCVVMTSLLGYIQYRMQSQSSFSLPLRL